MVSSDDVQSHHDSWLVEVFRKVRHRPDLIAGLAILTVGTAAVCWIGMWEVPWPGRIPIVILAPVILTGMTLGMIHDYTDPDERDSREWLDTQRKK